MLLRKCVLLWLYDSMRLTPITNIHSVRVFCLFVFYPDTNNTLHVMIIINLVDFFFGGGGGDFFNFPSNVNYTLTSNNDRWPYWLCSPSFCVWHWLKKLTALYFHQSAIVRILKSKFKTYSLLQTLSPSFSNFAVVQNSSVSSNNVLKTIGIKNELLSTLFQNNFHY